MSYSYYNIAVGCFRRDDISGSMRNLILCMESGNMDEDILNLAGVCSYFLCNFSEAHSYFKKSISLKSRENDALNYLSVMESQKFSEILFIYNKGLEYFNSNDFKEALNIFTEVNKRDKEFIEPYILIGLCNFMLNNFSRAETYWLMGIKRDSGNLLLLRYLIELDMFRRKLNNIKR